MIKADIIDLVHEKIGFSRSEAAEAVETVLDVMKEALGKGEAVRIVGFGNFVVRSKKEHVRRNPKTGKEIIIAPRKAITFKPSKVLRNQVDENLAAPVAALVEINLPQEKLDSEAVEKLQVAVREFMEIYGFNFQNELSTTHSSFFQRLQFWSKNKYGPQEVRKIFQQGKEILEQEIISRSHLDKMEIEMTGRLANAAVTLIGALDSFESGVIRLGEILIVKVTRRGKPILFVEIISPKLAYELTKNPILTQNPEEILRFIEENTKSQRRAVS